MLTSTNAFEGLRGLLYARSATFRLPIFARRSSIFVFHHYFFTHMTKNHGVTLSFDHDRGGGCCPALLSPRFRIDIPDSNGVFVSRDHVKHPKICTSSTLPLTNQRS